MSTSPVNARGFVDQDPEELLFRLIHDARAILRRSHVRAQMLEQKIAPQLDAEARAMFESVLASQRELDQLLARLATYADAGRSAPVEWMNLDTLILGAKLQVKSSLDAVSGEISHEKTAGIRAPAAFQAVLVEVFSNAIRFRRDNQPPRITISAQTAPEGPILRISDNGRGWDAANSEKMFEPLCKLEASAEGFGLGLAIARRIVQFSSGRMWADPRADGGDFFIELPGAIL